MSRALKLKCGLIFLMDHPKPRQQQQSNCEQVQQNTQPRRTSDALEGRQVAAPVSPDTSGGEGQFNPVVPLQAPPAMSETSPQVDIPHSRPPPLQTTKVPHVVLQPQKDQRHGTLQLSPEEWPTPGEVQIRGRHRRSRERHCRSRENRNSPQQQWSATTSPRTVQHHNKDSSVLCTQRDTPDKPEHHTEVSTTNQEDIHAADSTVKTLEVPSDASNQRVEQNEEGCKEEGMPTQTCSTPSTLCEEPIDACPQPSTGQQQIDYIPEVSTTNQEDIHAADSTVKTLEVPSDASNQRVEQNEEGCKEEGMPTQTCSTPSTLCEEPIDACPQPSTGQQQIDYIPSSGVSTPVPLASDSKPRPDRSSQSPTTAHSPSDALPDKKDLPDMDLLCGLTVQPNKSVSNPEHWSTDVYPSTFQLSEVPYQRINNYPYPNNLPPTIQKTASTHGEYVLPNVAMYGIFLRPSEVSPYYNYPDVHNNPAKYATSPPFYCPPSSQSAPMNYYPAPPYQPWPTQQQWGKNVEPQLAVNHQHLSGLQQQTMEQGQQGVYPHQTPVGDQIPVLQQHSPVAQQQHMLVPLQWTPNYQTPPVSQERYMMQYQPPSTQYEPQQLISSQQYPPPTMQQYPPPTMQQYPPPTMQQYPPPTMQQYPPPTMQQYPPPTMQQYPPPTMQQQPQLQQHFPPTKNEQLASQHYQPATILQQQQQKFPSTENEQVPSQQLLASHQYQTVSQQQILQMKSQVPVTYPMPETSQQQSVIQLQQGVVQHTPPVSHLPVPHNSTEENNQKTAVDQEQMLHPPQHQKSMTDKQCILSTHKASPEAEERQAGVRETHGLERPPRLQRPWVSDVEAAMIRGQAPVRSPAPMVSATAPALPIQPDFRRPPPPIKFLATAQGVNQPTRPAPAQQHRANGAHWPEQYQVPPRMLNNPHVKQNWTNPPPVGIPSRRGRGGSLINSVGRPIRGHGARLPGLNGGDSVQRVSGLQNQCSNMNGHGPMRAKLPQSIRSDAAVTTSNESTHFEQQRKNDSPKEPCSSSSKLYCQEENTNTQILGQDQHDSAGNVKTQNCIPNHQVGQKVKKNDNEHHDSDVWRLSEVQADNCMSDDTRQQKPIDAMPRVQPVIIRDTNEDEGNDVDNSEESDFERYEKEERVYIDINVDEELKDMELILNS
ncbi:bromodomain-containing protein 4-like [Schistocerca nitens]|uniref:bromodomain-containing protein 4-like n=1 Tax=Schistocerca nitens TaxID=7011 RepID=UPI00211859FB|nr:bromodomain-containing protein 4-like [Schistocerca nitens]